MAKEFTVWCDACITQQPEIRTAGTTLAVRIGDSIGALDLCEDHQKALAAPLAKLLAECGVPLPARPEPGVSKKQAEPQLGCPYCGLSYESMVGLSGHVARVHGAKGPGSGFMAAFGPWCPVCAVEIQHSVHFAAIHKVSLQAVLAGLTNGQRKRWVEHLHETPAWEGKQ